MSMVDSGKNCIVISRQGSHHVRRYGRDVASGMSSIKAAWKAHYANLAGLNADMSMMQWSLLVTAIGMAKSARNNQERQATRELTAGYNAIKQ